MAASCLTLPNMTRPTSNTSEASGLWAAPPTNGDGATSDSWSRSPAAHTRPDSHPWRSTVPNGATPLPARSVPGLPPAANLRSTAAPYAAAQPAELPRTPGIHPAPTHCLPAARPSSYTDTTCKACCVASGVGFSSSPCRSGVDLVRIEGVRRSLPRPEPDERPNGKYAAKVPLRCPAIPEADGFAVALWVVLVCGST